MWLLETNTRRAIEKAHEAGFMPTAEQQAAVDVMHAASGGDRIFRAENNTAIINIKGVLTKAPDWFSMYFGGGNTLYSEIIAAIHSAENDQSIDNVLLSIDSPGGQVDGLFDTLAALRDAKKPIKASVSNLAASAAFAVASQADSIVATNRAARVGSVGIVASFFVSDNEVTITSTKAPKKRPDLKTEKGQSVVREELDAMHDLFVEAIADGRGITPAKVNADFGQGSVILADEALKKGMVDAVNDPLEQKNETKRETKKMDIESLKAKHPDVYAEVLQVGIDAERDRVGAHLKMGEVSGDMKTASEAIKDGSDMTATLQATYMAAGMNRSDVTARQDDDASASAGDGATSSETNDDAGDKVASIVEKKLGLEA